ncbi:MAG: M20 metallopeptidase family protein [Planctomycetota bacterium]|jgi:amidohydrolase
MNTSLADQIERVLPEVTAFRHDVHAHPEVSRAEFETARKVREALAKLAGIEVLPPMMQTDVVAVLNADRDGPCIALRAELDALPIDEQTDLPYKSTIKGVMHACGHDGHAAILLGSAMVLSQMADQLTGKIKFIFQPDEESNGGGGVLCNKGVLDNPKVDAILALHGWPPAKVGTILTGTGPIMAASSPFEITVRGKGTHGAYPHRGVDPIVVAANIVTALQSIVSRTVDPLDPAVVTVGHISAGATHNVIPDTCSMKGTLRYRQDQTGEHLRRQLKQIVENTARAHTAQAEVDIQTGYPTMINETGFTRLVEETTRDLFGEKKLNTDLPFSMGVEDFAYYAQRIPATMFRLGLCPKDMDNYPNVHNPQFDFNDKALHAGISMFCEIAKRFLSQSK